MGKFHLAGWLALALSWQTPLSAQTFSLFQLETKDQHVLDEVSEKHEIVGRKGDTYDIYVFENEASSFAKKHPSAELLKQDADADWKPKSKLQKTASGYHDFEAVQAFMKEAASTYPDLVSLGDYGQSGQGRALNFLKLTGPESSTPKPKVLLDAATHGDELISTEVLIALTKDLLQGYGKDSRITAMLDQTEIYFSYVVNPDGFVNQNRYEGWSDPNRSYPWPGDPNKKATPSIQALMKLFEEKAFEGSMTFHAYGKLLMYPWGYTYDPIEDDEDRRGFEELSEQMAFANDYTYGPISKTIYVARGSSADYYYWKHKTKALAVELSTSKAPPSNRIPAIVTEAREMVWSFIESFSK